MEKMNGFVNQDGTILKFRCGLDLGPVVAGVIGDRKFIYDLWGDTVNTAARMETTSVTGKIQCTERFKEKVESKKLKDVSKKQEGIIFNSKEPSGYNLSTFNFVERGEIDIKGKGKMRTYFLESNK